MLQPMAVHDQAVARVSLPESGGLRQLFGERYLCVLDRESSLEVPSKGDVYCCKKQPTIEELNKLGEKGYRVIRSEYTKGRLIPTAPKANPISPRY